MSVISNPAMGARGELRNSLFLVLASVPGLLSLLDVLPAVPGVPRALLLLQPTLLLVLSAFAGSRLAARAGLRLAHGLSPSGRTAQLAIGILLGVAIAVTDHGLRGLWQTAPSLPPSIIEAWTAGSLLVGLLYGGVVEEVMFRWCVMSLLMVVLVRCVAGRTEHPPRWILPVAAIGAALLFAASHLPALVMDGASLAAEVVIRTLVLNGIAGWVFGLLYARHDLVAAMLAHSGTHLGFAVARMASEA